ncbi:MAG TPA: phosphodiester glycosidase family protein [Bacteroidales bacterium]|jgi:hypothetical protein|nr:phosphodiester glycosidase family protein [Bacteroidales bacterium]
MRSKCILLISLALMLVRCGSNGEQPDVDVKYITSIDVLSHQVHNVKVDNFQRTIELLFERGEDLSRVELKLTLADGVDMVAPQTATATYDLTDVAEIRLKKGNDVVTFKIHVRFKAGSLDISASHWEKKGGFGPLPDYITVYSYKKDISGKLTRAFIAVAEVGKGRGRFKVLGEKSGVATLTQFYTKNASPSVIINGGYFWNGTSLNLLIKNGVTVSTSEPMVNRDYNGQATPYYPTQGAFGMEGDGSFSAQWVYHVDGTLYAYPRPSPNVAGEKPQPRPSSTFPAGAKVWSPTEAIGAGPLLIKNGGYENLWENELFDVTSGVGPNYNHPRTAVGYHPNGYVIFFVCEGRNKTPNTPGMTLKNVADILLGLGCTEAINLDGGGSSCMLVNGVETIIPSDANGQRTVTSALAIY